MSFYINISQGNSTQENSLMFLEDTKKKFGFPFLQIVVVEVKYFEHGNKKIEPKKNSHFLIFVLYLLVSKQC